MYVEMKVSSLITGPDFISFLSRENKQSFSLWTSLTWRSEKLSDHNKHVVFLCA